MIIRQYTENDLPELAGLWSAVFGDPEAYINAFLALLPETGSCFVAEEKGRVISAAYILTGAAAVVNGKQFPAAYLYAAATSPDYRGQGAGTAVCRAAAEYAHSHDCLLYTLPAGDSLYSWYSHIINTDATLFTRCETVPAAPTQAIHPVSAEEYHRLRSLYCSGKDRLEVPLSWVRLLEQLCCCFGGGLFASDRAICACTSDGDTLFVCELLPVTEVSLSSSAAAYLGTESARCRLPGGPDSYIAYDRCCLPDSILWSYTFD